MIPLPGPVLTTLCCLLGGCAMLVLIGPRRRPLVRRALAEHPWRVLALSAAFAGCALTFQWAVKTTTVANAVLTHSLQALVTCLVFLPLMGAGWPGLRGLAALVLGLSGLGIVLWPQLDANAGWFGIAMGTASAVFFAWFNVQFRWFKGRILPDVLQCCNLLLSSIMTLPVALTMEWSVPGPIGIAALLGTTLGSYVLANKFYFYAMERIPVGSAATLSYIEPVIAICAAALLLGEPVAGHTALGGALVVASGVLTVWRPRT
jgi:drug/metabolite transporter (DMT)-like permease